MFEYLAGCQKRVAEFQERLLNNSEMIVRFQSMLDRTYQQDMVRLAESEDIGDSGLLRAQRIADFYRMYLGQYSSDLAKIISKKCSNSRKDSKPLSTCCRCATFIRGETGRRCDDCKNTCHATCIGFDFELVFGCLNIKQVSQLPSE